MPDLHAWITQQIDHRANLAERAAHYGRPDWPQPATAVVDTGEDWPITTEAGPIAEHISEHSPAAVLRRCAADRKTLTLHSAEPGQHPGFCGYDKHELPCPGLRLLAEAYGREEQPDA